MNAYRSLITAQHIERTKLEAARSMRQSPTPAEAALWTALRARRLKGLRFRRQQVIKGFIVDFYCHEKRLVIEVDGGVHDAQPQADRQRDEILFAEGLRLLRFSNDEVFRDLDAVLDGILTAATHDRL